MATKSGNYWKNRFDQIEQSANNKSTKYTKQLEKKYKEAAKELDGKINAWYQRLAANNGVSVTEAKRLLKDSELEEFKWTVQQYIEYGEKNAIDQAWMKELENASAKFHINRLEALKLECRQQVEQLFAGGQEAMYDVLADVYKDTFYHSCFEIQKGIGVGFDVSKLDDKQVQKLLMKPWSVDGENFSTKLWKNKTKLINTLDQEMTKMILTGSSPQKAIANIRKAMDTSQFAAKRLVLTEQAYFTSVAQKDTYGELDVEEYEIVATLDGRTSEICRDEDGKHYPVSEMQPGVNAPPYHVFCRTTTCPYFDDEFTVDDKRVARDEDGKLYEVPANMSYREWQKTFVDGGSKDGLYPVPTIKDKVIRNAHDSFNSMLANSDGDEMMVNRLIIASDSTKYELSEDINYPFAYRPSTDTIVYNPNAENYELYDMDYVMCHELAHKVDLTELHSWENKTFVDAFDKLSDTIINDPEIEHQIAIAFGEGGMYYDDAAMSDIFSALTKGKWNKYLSIGHSEEYWNTDVDNVYIETFANITSIDILQLNSKIEFEGLLKELFEAYKVVVR